MVPKKVGDELLRRRLSMRLTQTRVAEAIGTSRAYVSAVERGVGWDPDADKLVRWAVALGWEPDYLLRRLGREPMPPAVPTDLLALISRAVAEGVREGIAEALRDLRDEPTSATRQPAPLAPRHERPA